MNTIQILLAVLVLQTFSQTIQGQSEQVENIQEETKVLNHTYSLQPFVMGGAAIGQPTSFRLQAGIVKKWGFYVAGTTNFRFAKPYDCSQMVLCHLEPVQKT